MYDAVKTIDIHRIGALVIEGSGGARNSIFNERDVMRALAARDALIVDEPIEDHMTDPHKAFLPNHRWNRRWKS